MPRSRSAIGSPYTCLNPGKEVRRQDPPATKRDEMLDDQRDGQHAARRQRPDEISGLAKEIERRKGGIVLESGDCVAEGKLVGAVVAESCAKATPRTNRITATVPAPKKRERADKRLHRFHIRYFPVRSARKDKAFVGSASADNDSER